MPPPEPAEGTCLHLLTEPRALNGLVEKWPAMLLAARIPAVLDEDGLPLVFKGISYGVHLVCALAEGNCCNRARPVIAEDLVPVIPSVHFQLGAWNRALVAMACPTTVVPAMPADDHGTFGAIFCHCTTVLAGLAG